MSNQKQKIDCTDELKRQKKNYWILYLIISGTIFGIFSILLILLNDGVLRVMFAPDFEVKSFKDEGGNVLVVEDYNITRFGVLLGDTSPPLTTGEARYYLSENEQIFRDSIHKGSSIELFKKGPGTSFDSTNVQGYSFQIKMPRGIRILGVFFEIEYLNSSSLPESRRCYRIFGTNERLAFRHSTVEITLTALQTLVGEVEFEESLIQVEHPWIDLTLRQKLSFTDIFSTWSF